MGRRPKISREDVLQAAREAFAERGFEGTTLAGIAARLGVSPAALLRHAPTKEALFASAMSYHGPGEFAVPVEFLAELDGSEDPRLVVRRIGETFVPFLESKLDEQIAHWMRSKTLEEEARGIPLPFDPNVRPTPPQRVLRLVEDYLRRASAAGRLRVSDPLAAALMLFGAFQAYVTLHRIARILDPPLPLDRYIDTVVEVWMHGTEEGGKR
ncbi:MAG TPA: TetR/AcrR family transcriptional regulator [Thermoanaerobaculia bacterium]|nr:TetR/AcrR family transcriptional regulator [Thermoanaerobaculia bacterium]